MLGVVKTLPSITEHTPSTLALHIRTLKTEIICILPTHYSKLVVICVVLLLFVLFYVLFVFVLFYELFAFKCVLYHCHPIAVDKYIISYITYFGVINLPLSFYGRLNRKTESEQLRPILSRSILLPRLLNIPKANHK